MKNIMFLPKLMYTSIRASWIYVPRSYSDWIQNNNGSWSADSKDASVASASWKRITKVCAFDNVAVTFGTDESQWFEIPTYLLSIPSF